MGAAQMIESIENGNNINAVNMPGAVIPRTTKDPRVCVIHDNVPEMITQITGAVSASGANIENMVNAGTKGKVASYTMLDISELSDGLKEAIEKIEGVTRVRILP